MNEKNILGDSSLQLGNMYSLTLCFKSLLAYDINQSDWVLESLGYHL